MIKCPHCRGAYLYMTKRYESPVGGAMQRCNECRCVFTQDVPPWLYRRSGCTA